MKKLITALFLIFIPCAALAGYESVTVSNTAVGLSSSIPAYGGDKRSCVLTLEGAPVRFRFDGISPTSSEGHIMAPGGTLKLQGTQIAAFKAIRLNSVDATLKASCNDSTSADLKDVALINARTPVSYYAIAAAAGATTVETAISLTRALSTGATSTADSFAVTSGKKFRITSFSVATRGHNTATAQSTTFNLRLSSGATTTTSTPVVISARSATPATANAWDRVIFPIPDGYEITGDGTLQFGVTAAATYVTTGPTWDVNIIGYEY